MVEGLQRLGMQWVRVLALFAGLVALWAACRKVPYTGRAQFNLVPNRLMTDLGRSSYASMLADLPVERRGRNHQVLQQVGRRISRAAQKPEYDWQYAMIDSDEVNAWCLPGGYIGFYTGILPVLESEAGMAFVMGHEVAHATAHHGAERMSQQLALLGGLTGLELLASRATELTQEQRALILGALGVAGQVGVLLPFSRTHESEADVIGMMYMARAGYPPREAARVWQRMAQLSPNNVPVFLSTHPSHRRRQENLNEWLPQARKKYQRAGRRRRGRADVLETLWR